MRVETTIAAALRPSNLPAYLRRRLAELPDSAPVRVSYLRVSGRDEVYDFAAIVDGQPTHSVLPSPKWTGD